MASKKYYVVWAGHSTGVFDSWEECQLQIKNFPGARYKSFPNQTQAIEAYRGNPDEYLNLFRGIASHQSAQQVDYAANPDILPGSIAVDAACSGNPGPVEYRGVDISTGAQLFHVGPLQDGSNNMGEFLALVHALAWLKQRGLHTTPIYSDSRTALSWLRNRRVKTTIIPTPANAPIRDLLDRALRWLAANTYTNPILKWDTEKWGEIPADFGRK